MTPTRHPTPTVEQLCEGVNPDSPLEHIIVCPVCGQMFNCRESAAVSQPLGACARTEIQLVLDLFTHIGL